MKNHPILGASRRVLIVDRSAESREVFRTVLQRRGMKILEAEEPLQGLELARQHTPDLIVLDVEAVAHSKYDVCADYSRQTRDQNTPLVLLGASRDQQNSDKRRQCVRKPYHYGPLIRKIEELLSQAD